MLSIILALSLWGCVTVLSASSGDEEMFSRTATSLSDGRSAPVRPFTAGSSRTIRQTDSIKQAIWVMLGMSLMAAVAMSNYQWLMHLQGWIYTANLFILLLVLLLGTEVNGARSWIRLGPLALQPSELCKCAIIVSLAAFLCRRQEKMQSFSTILWSLLYITPPLLLIMKQPDFGTTMATLSIWFGMMFFGGARLTHLALVVLFGVAVFGYAWKNDRLKPHQKERLAVFLESKPSARAGYHVRQSEIAIGSGQISGQGWGQGMQNRAGYVPEKTTDFIFAVVAEELGFMGAASLMVLYLLLLLRCATAAVTTENYFGVLIAGGFTALLGFHTIVNLGMTMRIMPITGLPLPFFSYGGSSYLAFSISAGLLQSIVIRRRRNISV